MGKNRSKTEVRGKRVRGMQALFEPVRALAWLVGWLRR